MIRKMESHGYAIIKGEAFLNQLILNGNNPMMIPLWVPQSATSRIQLTAGITRRLIFNEDDNSSVDMYIVNDLPMSVTYTIDKAIEAYAMTRKVVARTPLTSSASSVNNNSLDTERRLAVAIRTGESTLRCKLSRENSSLRRPERVLSHHLIEDDEVVYQEPKELPELIKLRDCRRVNPTPEDSWRRRPTHSSNSHTPFQDIVLEKLPMTVPEPIDVDHVDMFDKAFFNTMDDQSVQIVMTD
jgi:hypothetical protein